MNTNWSRYVQTTEELYLSRALRFHRGNIDQWIQAMQLRDGMNILEVGCAGGLLCHQFKEQLPNAQITGLDFDTGHIEYAKKKSEELRLSCNFVAGDAANLPFESNRFDACYSHTVINFCEPAQFVREQYRVLKPGGRIVILCPCNMANKPEEWIPTDGCEEKELFDKLWAAAEKSPLSRIQRFEDRTEQYFEHLAAQGFRHIAIDAMAVVKYCPDSDNIGNEMALAQINEDRIAERSSVEKAHAMAPDALNELEYGSLFNMIDRRYDKRIRQYQNGEKKWEFRIATTALISGVK